MNNLEYLNNASAIITTEIPKRIISWITILIITFTSILIFGIYYKYPKYLNYQGNIIKENEKHLIKILVKEDDILNIKKGKLILNKFEIYHEIYYINPIYSIDIKEEKYYEILINCNLSDDLKYEQLPVIVKFELSNTTLMQEIINKIKKGMM